MKTLLISRVKGPSLPELNSLLAEAGVETLIVAGVTTEVCVHSTVREAGTEVFLVWSFRTPVALTFQISTG